MRAENGGTAFGRRVNPNLKPGSSEHPTEPLLVSVLRGHSWMHLRHLVRPESHKARCPSGQAALAGADSAGPHVGKGRPESDSDLVSNILMEDLVSILTCCLEHCYFTVWSLSPSIVSGDTNES